MLTIDPSKRATIRDIINHRWMTLSGEDPDFDRLISDSVKVTVSESEPINQVALSHMRGLTFDLDQAIKV